MADIAKLAKCSVMTVSLALRNSVRVSEARREEIQKLARDYGYRPNPLVSALNASRQRKKTAFQATIAFLHHFEDAQNWRTKFPSYAMLEQGIVDRATMRGYAVDTVWTRDPETSPDRWQKIMVSRGIQGMIIAPFLADGSTLAALDWERFSVVAVGYSVREPDFHRISHDYFHAMTTALARVRANGHRRIGFFVHQEVSSVLYNLWLAAYLAEQYTTPGAQMIPPLLLGVGEEKLVRPWASRHKLDAVIGLDLWSIEERGMSLPACVHRYSLDTDDAKQAVAGIRRDFAHVGSVAVDKLIDLLHRNEKGVPTRPMTTLVEGFWVNG